MTKLSINTTAGPVDEKTADNMVKEYQARGYKAVKKKRSGPGREGQYMVEVTTP